jgi:hypothetical protein
MSAQEFAETAALVASMEGDVERLAGLHDDMLPGELLEFSRQLEALRTDVLDARFRKLRELGERAQP